RKDEGRASKEEGRRAPAIAGSQTTAPKRGAPVLPAGKTSSGNPPPTSPRDRSRAAVADRDQRKQDQADQRKRAREAKARQTRLTDLESRIAAAETAIKDLESRMSVPGFYEDRTAAQGVIDQH